MRTPPICKGPVGLGANRTRTFCDIKNEVFIPAKAGIFYNNSENFNPLKNALFNKTARIHLTFTKVVFIKKTPLVFIVFIV